MSPQTKFEQWYATERRKRKIYVTSKDQQWAPLWKAIHWILLVLTFGKQNKFYTHYTTTIGRTIFYPAGWRFENATYKNCVILRHECDHVDWFLKFGLGNEWLGIFVVGLLYLLFPLPVCFAWFRYVFERVAYRTSYYAALELGLKPDIEHYIEQLTGPKYLWTWILKDQVRAWFRKHCRPDLLDQYSISWGGAK